MRKFISKWIKDTYGSKRGLLNHVKFQTQYHLGAYKKYRAIDWSRVERLVFVCHGNICRSPLGECYAKSLGANADSCGLDCQNDFPADPRAIAYAQSSALDLSTHITTHIAKMSFTESDLIIAMEPKHLSWLENANTGPAQITLAGFWLAKPIAYIHDPFSTNDVFFSVCEQTVINTTEAILERCK